MKQKTNMLCPFTFIFFLLAQERLWFWLDQNNDIFLLLPYVQVNEKILAEIPCGIQT